MFLCSIGLDNSVVDGEGDREYGAADGTVTGRSDNKISGRLASKLNGNRNASIHGVFVIKHNAYGTLFSRFLSIIFLSLFLFYYCLIRYLHYLTHD